MGGGFLPPGQNFVGGWAMFMPLDPESPPQSVISLEQGEQLPILVGSQGFLCWEGTMDTEATALPPLVLPPSKIQTKMQNITQSVESWDYRRTNQRPRNLLQPIRMRSGANDIAGVHRRCPPFAPAILIGCNRFCGL